MYDLRDPEFQAKLRERNGEAAAPFTFVSETPEPSPPVDAQPKPPWIAPDKRKGLRGPPEKYPWRTVELHHTFVIAAGAEQPKFGSIRAMASLKGKVLGKKFRTHRYPDGTIAVWREL